MASWVLTTTETHRRFYSIDPDGVTLRLVSRADDPAVSRFYLKSEAKEAAKRAGLMTWQYFNLEGYKKLPRR